jgi:hypothetical protein
VPVIGVTITVPEGHSNQNFRIVNVTVNSDHWHGSTVTVTVTLTAANQPASGLRVGIDSLQVEHHDHDQDGSQASSFQISVNCITLAVCAMCWTRGAGADGATGAQAERREC